MKSLSQMLVSNVVTDKYIEAAQPLKRQPA